MKKNYTFVIKQVLLGYKGKKKRKFRDLMILFTVRTVETCFSFVVSDLST